MLKNLKNAATVLFFGEREGYLISAREQTTVYGAEALTFVASTIAVGLIGGLFSTDISRMGFEMPIIGLGILCMTGSLYCQHQYRIMLRYLEKLNVR